MVNNGTGWIKAMRTEAARELIKMSNTAFCLLFMIAIRAYRGEGFNAKGLKKGEAFLGDHAACGMTEGQYREAKKLLAKHGFATFRATNKGTIATLCNNDVFDPNLSPSNGHQNEQTTDTQRANNEQTTTNEEIKKEKNPSSPSTKALWVKKMTLEGLEKERDEIRAELAVDRGNPALIKALEAVNKQIAATKSGGTSYD